VNKIKNLITDKSNIARHTALKRAEAALKDAHRDLEMKVQERTAELEAANEYLQREASERKLAAALHDSEFQDSELRYRLLFEANPQPMWVYDRETLTFLAVNRAAINHYGFAEEEFLAMTIKEIRPPEEVPALLHSVANATDGIDASGTRKHLKKDGSIIDVEITSHQLDFGGRPAKMVLVFDVTARKWAESELLLEKARFQQLFENTPMGILRVDEHDRVVDANREFESMFQYSLDELRGRRLDSAIVPETRIAEGAALSFETLQGRTVEKETGNVKMGV
jgi:PAS domain S-box-containing protein